MTVLPENNKRHGRYLALFLSALFMSVFILAQPAAAQQNVSDRLNRLENEIQTLSRALFKGEQPPAGSGRAQTSTTSPSVQAGMEVRLSQLEMMVRNLTGQVEQLQYQNRQMEEKLQQNIATLEMRLMDYEARLSGRVPSSGSTEVYQPVPGTNGQKSAVMAERTTAMNNGAEGADEKTGDVAQGPTGQLGTLKQSETGDLLAPDLNDPAAAYEQSFNLLKDKQYEQAEAAFTSFLERFGSHKLAPNATYWLGETHYVRQDYERAARVFAEAYQKYPDGPKGPDNLLKLALSLEGLGKKKDACVALAQLKQEYPSGANPVLARAEQEMTRLKCR